MQEEASLRALWEALVARGICTKALLLKCAEDVGLVVPGSNLGRLQLDAMRKLRAHSRMPSLVSKLDLPDHVIKAQTQVMRDMKTN